MDDFTEKKLAEFREKYLRKNKNPHESDYGKPMPQWFIKPYIIGTDLEDFITTAIQETINQQKQTCKEIDPNCPCWLDGFRTAEAEQGFEWKQELREKIEGMKIPKSIKGKIFTAIENTVYRSGYKNALNDILELL